MALSINTNPSALIALGALTGSTQALAESQDRVSSGLRVGGVEDDSSAFTIAQGIRADIGGLNAIQGSISRATGTLDVATTAGSNISDLLVQARGIAVQASDASLDQASLDALSGEFNAIVSQIDSIAGTADFNGTNLVDGSGSVAVPAAPDGSTTGTSVAGADLSAGGLGLTVTSFGSAADAQAALGEIDAGLTSVNATLAGFGAATTELDLQGSFLSDLQDTLTVGVGNLVDADLGEEAANLAADQVRVELGIAAQNIANASPRSLLALFQG
ncbi:MAG: flagellin [Rhodothalassiaceae bacterium]